jgi:hypothetical protein
MFRSAPLIATLTLSAISLAFSAPKIEVDKTTFDCGTVAEGQTDKLHASFTIKNTGDSPLAISNVRPGCGCTVVKFDTLVLPGKTSAIQATVNITGYRSGEISKYITVSSNAANTGSMKLTITATIKSVIDISEQYISLTSQKPHTLTLACEKKDLRVVNVGLSSSAAPGATTWQSNLPLPIAYKWTPTDSTRKDGMHVFKLELTAPEVKDRMAGQLVLTTNHPEKPEIRLQGAIEK